MLFNLIFKYLSLLNKSLKLLQYFYFEQDKIKAFLINESFVQQLLIDLSITIFRFVVKALKVLLQASTSSKRKSMVEVLL